jgi:hypothetical protein
MYSRSFFDPDGHGWQVMWIDPAALEQGPEAFAASSSALGPPDRADRGDRAQVLDQHPVDGESALA